ncbi:MAG: hypothetical protein N2C12_01450, partial [Planctomycetales bacterium]
MPKEHFILEIGLGSALVTAIVLWGILIARSTRGKQILATEPRRLVPWRGWQVAVAFFLYLAAAILANLIVMSHFKLQSGDDQIRSDIDVITWMLASDSLLRLVCVGLVIAYLRIDLKVRLSDLGWDRARIFYDCLIGLITFLMVVPFIYMIQASLSKLYLEVTGEEPAHVVVKTIQENPTAEV